MKILYVTARFPYPPFKGDQAVSYNRLRLLGGKHRITLLTFYQRDLELSYQERIKPFCEKIIAIKLDKLQILRNALTGVFSELPLQISYFKSSKFMNCIDNLLDANDFDIIHTFMLRMAEYTKNIKSHKILDLIDSMQLNFERRAILEKQPAKMIFSMELNRIKKYEANIVNKYDVSIVVSKKDQEYIGSSKVVSIPLGVDTEMFKPCGALKNDKIIIFSGSMGYFPNENAALWFTNHVFDCIRREIPNVRFIIAGNNPSKTMRKLHDGRRIIVTGFVESIVNEMQKAQLAVAPMQSGSGMQFKILEAMSCGLPVVATSMGVGTISATNNVNIIIEDDPEPFAHACINLLKDYRLSKNIGDNARQLILAKYSWESHVDKVEVLYKSVMNESVSKK